MALATCSTSPPGAGTSNGATVPVLMAMILMRCG
jgi:hypothetical protein